MGNQADVAVDDQMKTIKKAPIVIALLIGAFVTLLNQTLINVALPKIMGDLSIDTPTAQWLITGFMLVNGVLVPVTAYLMAKFSTRQLFLGSMVLFTLGTILCGLAPNFAVILIGRLVQASGAGILMPLMTVVLLNIFPIEKRGQAMGMVGVAMIFAPAIGPTLSGYIVQNYDWRVLFWIILPVSVIALLIGALFLKNVTQLSNPKLDKLSVVLSTLGFGGLLYGFSSASDGWDRLPVYGCLIIGAISLLLFIRRQLRASEPMLEFRIFKYNMYSLTTAINVIVTMSMYAGMILLPLFLQNVRGFTPLESGLLLLPGSILMGIMSPVTGMIFDKVGARWLSIVGLLIMTITTLEFSRLSMDTSYTELMINYTVRMFGMSMIMMPIQTAGLNQLPNTLNAHGTAMSNTLRTIAGSIGTAVLVTIMTIQSTSYGEKLALTQQVSPTDASAMSIIKNEALVYGINHAFLVATILSAVSLILAFFIKNTNPRKQEEGATAKKSRMATSS
ncbi:DHA2 family efflux MFS transporter permease subunit [Paenibacillus massiliensis]|uniref:DHA2 family efflux MFS transporter permease subunit n=1 Tax=Paenibacillus massiliensis TaxID=225917 RepID=UPI000418C68A|nr:DHA2 family efflux MFS transporter permease subunit [Paenibacillus massiliensis]